METINHNFVYTDAAHSFPLGTDAMLLGDFAPAAGRICDLCGGGGSLSLLLLSKAPACRVTLVELQEAPCRAAEENRRINALEERLTVVHGDLRQIRSLLPPGSFDGVVCNPPYYPAGSGKTAKDPAAALARTELGCTLDDVCAAAAWLLPTGGTFCLCHKPERLADVFCELRTHGLEAKTVRLVQDRSGKPPFLVLVRAVRGGRPGLVWQPTLLLCTPDGSPTPEYRKIYHMEEPS